MLETVVVWGGQDGEEAVFASLPSWMLMPRKGFRFVGRFREWVEKQHDDNYYYYAYMMGTA